MHYSLGGAGLGCTSVDCVLSVCVSGWVCPGFGGSQLRCALTSILEPQGAVFVSASHQTGLDTRLMTVEIRVGEGQAQAKARALLDYADHRPT